MSLLEEIQARRPKRMCAFGRWVESADPKDRADIAKAFTIKAYPATDIAAVLTKQIPGSFIDALRDHRQGRCPICPLELLNVAS